MGGEKRRYFVYFKDDNTKMENMEMTSGARWREWNVVEK